MKPTFKPILFNTDMVQAILDGRKLQTRRIVKDKLLQESVNEYDEEEFLKVTVKSKYKVGDILWVRETWQYTDDLSEPFLYRQKYEDEHLPEYYNDMKWKPSIFMPKEACRIFLKITEVRVERLQDITEEDALAEGVEKNCNFESDTSKCLICTGLICKNTGEFYHYTRSIEDFPAYSAVESFQSLWESINDKGSWNANPWVWVITFERIDKPEGFLN